MSGRTMLHLTIVLGLLTLGCGVVLARLRPSGPFGILGSIVFRFSCLLIGIAATAYWAAVPGLHPISAWGSALLLLAYVVSGEERLRR